MSGLTIDDFDEFYKAVHKIRRFRWQAELSRQVHADGRWPDLVDLPTGSGKTSFVDIAVFLLAVDAERRFARRIVMVVDRRTIVDQAALRGQLLRERLMTTHEPVLAAVADRLRALFGGRSGQPPLVAGTLRGGLVRDDSWAHRPDMPAVIASTVDQVGSRLLFRGYGVSPRMRPIYAGLLGSDTLFLLDEVHLSQPFAQTLGRLGDYRGWAERSFSTPWQVVELSATPGRAGGDRRRFPESRALIDDDPALAPRINAEKPATLRLVKGASDDVRDRRQLVDAIVEEVDRLTAHDHVRTLGVIVNRVQTAAAIATLLKARDDLGAVLLTGRMRPYDRDDLLRRHIERLRSGRDRTGDEPRLVVVATQSIEAGADFDLDGIITECASLDALRQRFGRVDRTGYLATHGTPSVNTVVATSNQVKPGADDFVYGTAVAATWQWLSERDQPIDFGVRGMSVPATAVERAPLLPPAKRAPVLLPAHLDAWVQTRPGPQPDPDPALWLHGLERPLATDVSVVWRADLTEAFLAERDPRDGQPTAADLVEACPPVSGEALAVPIGACRRWLQQRTPADLAIADVDGAEVAPEESRSRSTIRPFLKWDRGKAVVGDWESVKPGDTIVVPAAYGGLTLCSWDPSSTDAVADLGHRGQYEQRHRAVLRLVPPLLPDTPSRQVPKPPLDPDEDEPDLPGWLEEHQAHFDGLDRLVVDHFLAKGVKTKSVLVSAPAFTYDEAEGRWSARAGKSQPVYVMIARQPVPVEATGNPPHLDLPDTEDESAQFIGDKVWLTDHLDDVGDLARRLAARCGLPDEIASDLALAGRLHDLGKADPRFQVILHGDELAAAIADKHLAKSGMTDLGRRERDLLQQLSRYPVGARHEILSVAMIQEHLVMDSSHDRDLVLHLVGSHHGWCRPFAPPVVDPEPVKAVAVLDSVRYEASSDHGLARLDSGVADRFWRLVRRYGWHGLAWLEAILRLADHRCSEMYVLGGRHDRG